MVNISIPDGKGITHGILNELKAENVDTAKINGSIWSQVMSEVKTQNEGEPANKNLYSGGSIFLHGKTEEAKQSWKDNFNVAKGAVITISDAVWNKIKSLVQGGTQAPTKANPVSQPTVPAEKPTAPVGQTVAPKTSESKLPKGAPDGTLSEDEVQQYLANDDKYKYLSAKVDDLDAKMKTFEDTYHFARAKFDGGNDPQANMQNLHGSLSIFNADENKDGVEDVQQYSELSLEFNSVNRLKSGYKKIISNWKDTPKGTDVSNKIIQHNGRVFSEVRHETLLDGTKVYNTSDGYYAIGFDGYPADKKMSAEELAKHGVKK